MKPITGGIYVIRNVFNGRLYVGSSRNLKKRRREHFWRLRKDKHENRFLQADFNKCGLDAFVFEIVSVPPPERLLEEEQIYLDRFFDDKKQCYNISKDAAAIMTGRKHTKYSRNKMRLAQLGKHHTEETKRKIGLAGAGNKHRLGTKMTEEAKQKIRVARLGKKKSVETRKRMSEAQKGRARALRGKKLSPESIRKRTLTRARLRALKLLGNI